MIVDALLEHRKAVLTPEDIDHLIAGLEQVLKVCSTLARSSPVGRRGGGAASGRTL
jgi:hypothetical protein